MGREGEKRKIVDERGVFYTPMRQAQRNAELVASVRSPPPLDEWAASSGGVPHDSLQCTLEDPWDQRDLQPVCTAAAHSSNAGYRLQATGYSRRGSARERQAMAGRAA